MNSAPVANILLDTLKEGVYDYSFTLDNVWFAGVEKSEILGGEVVAEARLNIQALRTDLHIKVSGTVQVTCDRCLDAMDIPVQGEDDIEVEPDTKELDLCWLAYELTAVNLPLVHSHPEGGCNPEMVALLQDHLRRTEEEPEEA